MKKCINIIALSMLSTLTSSVNALGIDVVHQALSIELLPCDVATNLIEEVEDVRLAARDKYRAGDFIAALEITVDGLQRFPKSFSLQRYFAMLIADCSEHGDAAELFSESLKNQTIIVSKQVFEKLMHETEGQPAHAIFLFKNEYYWRFAQYENEYENGLQFTKYYVNTDEFNTKGFLGYFCQGVGATCCAKQLLVKGETELAHMWAYRAVDAWNQYLNHDSNYYLAYVTYGLALGILGRDDEMMKALQQGADLIHKDLHAHEFKEVIDFIASIKLDKLQNV